MLSRLKYASILFLTLSSCLAVAGAPEDYAQRYEAALGQPNQLISKVTDNKGDGWEDLYGTRNLRVVLHGIYYRGGANNAYHRDGARDNMNPLPDDGLENLCREGFSKAIYYYPTNFRPKEIQCESRIGGQNKIKYAQVTVLEDKSNLKFLMKEIFDCIHSKGGCPIYGHCWNGWHASGLAAALVLRQYCDFTPDQGVQYWIDGTDGVGNSNYPAIKATIRNFTPFEEFKIDGETRKRICPRNPYRSFVANESHEIGSQP